MRGMGGHLTDTNRVETDQSFGSFGIVNRHPPFPSPLYTTHFVRGAAAVRPLVQLGGDWCHGASLVLSLPKPSLVSAHDCRRRASFSSLPIPFPHVDQHLSDSATLLRLSRCPHSRVLTPPPLTLVYMMSPPHANCGLCSSSRHRFCLRSRTPRLRLQFGELGEAQLPDTR